MLARKETERPVLSIPREGGSCIPSQHSRRLGQDNQSSSLNQEERTPAPRKEAVTGMAKEKISESMQ